MSDDGILFGGNKDGADIFDKVRSKASSPPGVLVGPDSIGVMSFTSGSEGRPKCVLGRHYSLAKYFPWMAERFNLSADSKFACLSGIAHDPIQRGKTCLCHHISALTYALTQIFSRPCSSGLSC
jgi:L-aminoadipate-semialdehyde dehydrogenase